MSEETTSSDGDTRRGSGDTGSTSTNTSSRGTDVVTESLRHVVRGAAVVVVATLIGVGLRVAGRAVFTRSFTPSEYGVFSVGFTLVSVFGVVASLGFRNGVTRQIAYYGADSDGEEGEGEGEGEVGTVILWALLLTGVSGSLVGAVLFMSSGFLAETLVGSPDHALAVGVVCLGVPFFALIRVSTAVFRGFSRTRERVVFHEILRNAGFPILVVGVSAVGLSYVAGVGAYPVSLLLTAVLYLGYTVTDNPAGFSDRIGERLRDFETPRKLVVFSVPLMFSAILMEVMTWMDILMIGYFETAEDVGMYDAVRPLVRVVPVVWGSMIFMYTPLVSEFHAEGRNDAMRRVYFVLTKWFASATYPLIVVFVLFPEAVLGGVFGAEYTRAATALQILSVAFFLGNIMGPNGATLTAIGKTRVVMWANLGAFFVNLGLNVYLIPVYGLTGAAVATAAALVIRNVARVVVLYYLTDAHSFKKPLVVPMGVSTALVLVGHRLIETGDGMDIDPMYLPVVLGAVVVVFLASFVVTRNVSDDDRDVLLTLSF
ncbi:MAG: flippase [Halobacteria archaeon]|nr:flippase [Halobacteria archaeon]